LSPGYQAEATCSSVLERLEAHVRGNFQRLVINVTNLANLTLHQRVGMFYSRDTALPAGIQLTNIIIDKNAGSIQYRWCFNN
jgi:hypothetical protein